MMARKRGPFPLVQVLSWADQLLDALDYLHTQDPQIVHRDIKPQNLKLTSRGQIILLDFGLAKGQVGEISRVTTSASIFGYTPNYAPLEQIQGLGTDSRSDLYSLGATIYHLMTGVKPPDALTRAAALVNGQPDPLVRASEANPGIAPELDEVLAKSMAQNREQRYASASEMRQAFHENAEATTIADRSEAQTMLFPRPAPTVPIQTQTVVKNQTVAAGETTVVRPASRGRFIPVAISAAVLILVACGALGFYALQKRSDTAAQLSTEAPRPPELPASSPSPTQEALGNVAPSPSPSKEEKPAQTKARTEEPRKTATPKPQVDPGEDETAGHSEDPRIDPDVPIPPDVPKDGRAPKIKTKVMPGGMVIRTFPDGTSLVTMPDGSRILVSKDGKRTTLGPPRPNRRRQVPVPAPSPSP